MQDLPEYWVHHTQREAESTLALLTVSNDDVAGRQQCWNTQRQSAESPAVLGAAKYERALFLRDDQRHRKTAPDALFQPGRPRKTLDRPNDLREPAGLVINPRPKLGVAHGIPGHHDDGRCAGEDDEGQWCASESSELRPNPTDDGAPRFGDFSDEDDGFPRR
jgi:hypothetical protein